MSEFMNTRIRIKNQGFWLQSVPLCSQSLHIPSLRWMQEEWKDNQSFERYNGRSVVQKARIIREGWLEESLVEVFSLPLQRTLEPITRSPTVCLGTPCSIVWSSNDYAKEQISSFTFIPPGWSHPHLSTFTVFQFWLMTPYQNLPFPTTCVFPSCWIVLEPSLRHHGFFSSSSLPVTLL